MTWDNHGVVTADPEQVLLEWTPPAATTRVSLAYVHS
jgi:hypothetical protein